MTSRLWYSVELDKEMAEAFRLYLKRVGIKFEPSEAYNLIHFQCYMSIGELEAANKWLDFTRDEIERVRKHVKGRMSE